MHVFGIVKVALQHKFMPAVARVGHLVGRHQPGAQVIGVEHSVARHIADAGVAVDADVGISAQVHAEVALEGFQAADCLLRHDQAV